MFGLRKKAGLSYEKVAKQIVDDNSQFWYKIERSFGVPEYMFFYSFRNDKTFDDSDYGFGTVSSLLLQTWVQ